MALAETTAPMLDARRRILDAALRCFAASGFHGASMQEICSAAKMSPGGLYRHFASKDEIIAAIAEHVRLRNASYFACLLAEGAGLETFLDTGFAYLREVTEGSEAALCAEVFAEAQRNPRIRSLFEANHEQARATLTAALEKARERGDIDPGIDLATAVTILLAIGDGLIVRMPFAKEARLSALEPGIRDLLTRMLRPAPCAAKGRLS